MSLGVLDGGQVVHYANFGYRDVAAQIPPNEDTIYVVASLSKAFTSAMTGILVEEGELRWDTPVRDIIPEYQRAESDSAYNATVTDFLSHRAGIAGADGYWMLSDGKVAFARDQMVPILNSLPTVQPIRTAFIYHNIGYELLGQIIEKVTGTTVGNFLKESIMKPLGMKRTFDTRIPSNTLNVAKPYASLQNRSLYELAMPLVRQDGLFSAAGGLRTSVSDLLIFYNALIDARISQQVKGDEHIPGNPLRQLGAIWTAMISLPFPSLRENSYALGWVRAQLPSTFGLDGPGPLKATVGQRGPSPLTIYHQGIIQGFTSFSALIPETRSAVVVLTNSGGLNEATLLIGSAVVDTLLDATIDDDSYAELARAGYRHAATSISRTMKELRDGQQLTVPTRLLDAYTGRYYNSLQNFFIDIRKSSPSDLVVSFMGNAADTFPLEPYDSDTFFWHLTHNECVMRGRLAEPTTSYYFIKFAFSENDTAADDGVLYWKYDADLPGDGEPFRKLRPNNPLFWGWFS